MSISEQAKGLREIAAEFNLDDKEELTAMLDEAANTIESLTAKLAAANLERPKGNYSIGNLSGLIDKFNNEKIKGLTDFEQVQIFNVLKYLDMYQKVSTIENLWN